MLFPPPFCSICFGCSRVALSLGVLLQKVRFVVTCYFVSLSGLTIYTQHTIGLIFRFACTFVSIPLATFLSFAAFYRFHLSAAIVIVIFVFHFFLFYVIFFFRKRICL